MNAIYDLEIKQAQADNLKAQNSVIKHDAALRAAQLSQTQVNTDSSKFDLGLKSELRGTSAEAMRENLRVMQTNRQIALADNERKAILHSPTLETALQTVLNMREQNALTRQTRKNMLSDGTLKQYEVDLRKLGIVPGGPWWSAIVGRLLTNYTPQQNKVKNFIKSKYR